MDNRNWDAATGTEDDYAASHYGSRLRDERKRLGLTQARFAQIGKVSVATQNGYEAGLRIPPLDYLHRLSRAGVNSHYVLTGEKRSLFNDLEANWKVCWPIIEAISAYQPRISGDMTWRIARLAYAYFEGLGGFDGKMMQELLDIHRGGRGNARPE